MKADAEKQAKNTASEEQKLKSEADQLAHEKKALQQ